MLNKIKNKKGELGEQIEDLISFAVVFLILILLFVFAVIFHNQGVREGKATEYERIRNDKFNLILSSFMREKQGENIIFSDLIRARNEEATKRLEEEIRNMCLAKQNECSIEVNYNAKCEISSSFHHFFCWYIPAEKDIVIIPKIFSGYNYEDVEPIK